VGIAILFTPLPEEGDAPPLSSYSHQPTGSRGLYESLERLGFDVSRRLRPMRDETLPVNTVWVVLAPTSELTAFEVHNLLESVRAGAGLLLVLSQESRLGDSLGIRRAPAVPRPRTQPAPAPPDSTLIEGGSLVQWVLRPAERNEDSTRVLQLPAGSTRLLDAQTREGREPVVAGLTLGAGRIVVGAADEMFTNETLREVDPAVRIVRYIERLNGGPGGRRLVFDEYHHGYGTHADVLGVTQRALTRTSAGRTVLQVSVAALVLLLSVASRPIRPVARERIERRSPLEHVDAMARAYSAIDARSRATRLLIRGVRRRHGTGRAVRDEEAWLTSVAALHPAVTADVDRLIAEIRSGAPDDGEGVVAAIQHIEEVISP
jgi:Domain of unknown function (DUF4350)